MKFPRMLALAAAAAIGFADVVTAASITGIMVYTTDDFGDPNGMGGEPARPEANLWMTAVDPKWYSLAVFDGLLPESLYPANRRALNEPSFDFNRALQDGENFFTLVGQPGKTTVGDEYARYAMNIYFDGRLDVPGISVLFPRDAALEGSPTTRSRAQAIYSFGAKLLHLRVPGVDDAEGYDSYDDGIVRVSVTAASMLFSKRVAEFGDEGIDLVHDHIFRPSAEVSTDAEWEQRDFIGSLIVTVEPSTGQPAGSGGGFIPGPGSLPSGPRAGFGDTGLGSAGSAPYVPGYANAPQQYDDGGVDFEYDGDTAVDEYGNTVLYGEPRTPTPRDAVDLVKNWLQGGLGTPTPALTAAMTAGIETPGTLTPDAGGDDGEAGANEPTTPTAAAMPTTPAVATVAATTDTPAVTKTVATVVAASPTPSPPTPTPTAGRTGSPGPTQTARK